MLNNNVVAIIPARSGSKSLVDKNIKLLSGHPLIAYSIAIAKLSKKVDRVIVSTNSQRYADIAKQYGAEVPFTRPKELSDDYATTSEVVIHAINWLKENNCHHDVTCCIYATAPFIRSQDIRNGFDKLSNTNCNFVFPVTNYPFPIQRAVIIDDQDHVRMFCQDKFFTRSQDLEVAYHDAGQFYWGRNDAWLNKDIIFSSESIAIKLPRYRVQDIDTLDDWETAEQLFQTLIKNNKL